MSFIITKILFFNMYCSCDQSYQSKVLTVWDVTELPAHSTDIQSSGLNVYLQYEVRDNCLGSCPKACFFL